MKNNIILVLKGFIIGIAKIIPGVSGALLAISLNVYAKGINAICNFFENKKENFKLLFYLGIGIVLAIILFSKIISYCLSNYYFITMWLFIGLVIGGLFSLFKEVKVKISNTLVTVIAFLIIFFLTYFTVDNDYVFKNNFVDNIVLFLSGILEAIGTVVPGVSSTALLMIVGLYDTIINTISNLTSLSLIKNNLLILFPFMIGLFCGLILSALVIDYLLKKHKEKTYCFIIGICLASVVLLFIKSLASSITIANFIIGVIFLILGIVISLKLDR